MAILALTLPQQQPCMVNCGMHVGVCYVYMHMYELRTAWVPYELIKLKHKYKFVGTCTKFGLKIYFLPHQAKSNLNCTKTTK